MSIYEDLSPLNELCQAPGVLLAVGWLGPDMNHAVGDTSRDIFRRIQDLMQDAPLQFGIPMGVHACQLCQHEGESSGSRYLIVPGHGLLYGCPELILHYINAHRYRPPDAFIAAVQCCPPTNSPEYRLRFLNNGGREALSAQLPTIG